MKQSTNKILLVKPAHFAYNEQTASSNAFQNAEMVDTDSVQEKALLEFEGLASTLRSIGVEVIEIEDSEFPVTPDAVFPNNWLSLHEDGTIVLYPMCAPNRRLERRKDILDRLGDKYSIKEVIDLSHSEEQGQFLEGTGSIVFDHLSKVAYACISQRTDRSLFENLCKRLNYRPICFIAVDSTGKAIYHTNVMMCIGTGFAVICAESIPSQEQRKRVQHELVNSGREIVEISLAQMARFAGNMLEMETGKGERALVLSKTAFDSLSARQKAVLAQYCELLPIGIPTIEQAGGGSVRCMMAEVFLSLH